MESLAVVALFATKLVCIIAFTVERILGEIVNGAVNVKTCRLQASAISA